MSAQQEPLPQPPPAGAPGQQTTKIWRSDLGLCAVLDDATQTMTLSDATGQNKVEVSVATGTVTVKGVARIVVDGQVVQIGSGQARHPARQVTLGRRAGDPDIMAVRREPSPHGRETGGRPAAARCRRTGMQEGEGRPDLLLTGCRATS